MKKILIPINESNSSFTYASFKERYYNHVNQLPQVAKVTTEYTPVIGYEPYDCTYVSGDTRCVVEFKLRKINSYTYSTALLEGQKYDHLMQIYQETGLIPYYQNYYKDGKVLIWNLLNFQDLQPSYKSCPGTTKGDQTFRDKVVYWLPVDQAMTFTYRIPGEDEVIGKFYSKYTVVNSLQQNNLKYYEND